MNLKNRSWSASRAGGMSYWLICQGIDDEGVRRSRTLAQINSISHQEMEVVIDTLNQGEEHLQAKEAASKPQRTKTEGQQTRTRSGGTGNGKAPRRKKILGE